MVRIDKGGTQTVGTSDWVFAESVSAPAVSFQKLTMVRVLRDGAEPSFLLGFLKTDFEFSREVRTQFS